MSTATADPGLRRQRTPSEAARRLVGGDFVSVRVILAIAVIWIIFQSQNDRFLSSINLTNLILQITATGLISVGVVFVLLLGEIDLSVGAVSGVTSARTSVMVTARFCSSSWVCCSIAVSSSWRVAAPGPAAIYSRPRNRFSTTSRLSHRARSW